MFKNPDTQELLEIAREAFVADILPQVSPDKRYLAAMIGNAMAIAQRQSAGVEDRAEQELLHAVYGHDSDANWQQFADDLRSGTISEQTHPQLLDDMINALRQELSVSNPKFRE